MENVFLAKSQYWKMDSSESDIFLIPLGYILYIGKIVWLWDKQNKIRGGKEAKKKKELLPKE